MTLGRANDDEVLESGEATGITGIVFNDLGGAACRVNRTTGTIELDPQLAYHRADLEHYLRRAIDTMFEPPRPQLRIVQ